MPNMTEPRRHALGKRLLELRKARDLTIREASAKIKVSERTWRAWERNEFAPSEAHLVLIELLEAGKL